VEERYRHEHRASCNDQDRIHNQQDAGNVPAGFAGTFTSVSPCTSGRNGARTAQIRSRNGHSTVTGLSRGAVCSVQRETELHPRVSMAMAAHGHGHRDRRVNSGRNCCALSCQEHSEVRCTAGGPIGHGRQRIELPTVARPAPRKKHDGMVQLSARRCSGTGSSRWFFEHDIVQQS